MSDVPPVGTQLGDLILEEVFLDYDGPKLFSCRDPVGQRFIAVLVDEDEDSETYLYVPISADRLAAVRSGRLTLRSAFASSKDGTAYSVRTYLDRVDADVEALAHGEIPEDWLPAEAAVLNLPSSARILSIRRATAPLLRAWPRSGLAAAASGRRIDRRHPIRRETWILDAGGPSDLAAEVDVRSYIVEAPLQAAYRAGATVVVLATGEILGRRWVVLPARDGEDIEEVLRTSLGLEVLR